MKKYCQTVHSKNKNEQGTVTHNTEQHITQNICTQEGKYIYTRDTDRQGIINDTGPTREHPVKDTGSRRAALEH